MSPEEKNSDEIEEVTEDMILPALEKVAETSSKPPQAPPPQQPQAKAQSPAKEVEARARAEIAVAQKKEGIKKKLPTIVDFFIIIIIFVLAFTLVRNQENTILRNFILISVMILIISKRYIYEWLSQRFHLPEYFMNPWLLLELVFCFLVLISGLNTFVSLLLIGLVFGTAKLGPPLVEKINEWREKRAEKKGKKIEKKGRSLDERAAKMGRAALLLDILDFGVGLIPFVGDAGGFFVNMLFPIDCLVHGVIGLGAFLKMVGVNIADGLIGLIPVIGDVADIMPANLINRGILKKEIERKKAGMEKGASTVAIVFVVMIIGFVLLAVFAIPFLAQFGGPLGEAAYKIAGLPTHLGIWWGDNNPIIAITSFYRKQMYMATGDYYVGKVDENAKAKLGVYLEDIKQSDPTFFEDRSAVMYATLKVQTLDDPIDVTLSCNSTGMNPGFSPEMFPKQTFSVDLYEEQDIDCMFAAGSLKKGVWKFTLGAEFDFKTMAYVKSYFMDADRLRGLRRAEIDPLEQYGVKDKSPIATYTTGPVGIGMSVGKPPVGIDPDAAETTVILGITLDNSWTGKIKKIKKLVVILPKAFALEQIGSPFTLVSCEDLHPTDRGLCNDQLHSVYIINDDPPLIERGSFKSYRGYIRVKKEDYEKLLGKGPLATHYFKVLVEYTYILEKTKGIEVRRRVARSLRSADVDISGPTIQLASPFAEKVDANSVRLSWTTSEESNDMLIWWDTKTPSAKIQTPNEENFTEGHTRTLAGLTPGKEYGYTISSSDRTGNPSEKTGFFTMPR